MSEAVPAEDHNPFPGLRSYEQNESLRLFGRDADLSLITTRLLSCRTTLLFAGSGVGKTSFLEAKLIPEMTSRFFILSHRQWAGTPPLAAVRETVEAGFAEAGVPPLPDSKELADCFRAATQHEGFQKNRFILILDQFEELFQHHRETHALSRFVSNLASLLSDSALDIRIVFSMREEFLGELSVFDNLIGDLFNNYYRLKNLEESQARDVIEQTSDQVQVSLEGLDSVLHDLRRLNSSGKKAENNAPRKYIAPPYLQLVCHQIWAETKPDQTGMQFLSTYKPGDAGRQLQQYCRTHLESLSEPQKALACDAFAFLMTKRGAKMAYARKDLADLMRVDERVLRPVLEKLSDPSVRILRSFADPPWFELYHDMYAPFLIRWKSAFDIARKRHVRKLEAEASEQRRLLEAEQKLAQARKETIEREKARADEQQQRLQAMSRADRRVKQATAALMCVVAVFAFAWNFGYRASREVEVLKDAAAALQDPARADAIDHHRVVAAHDYLDTYGVLFERFSKTPPSLLWSRYWDRKVEQKTVAGHQDEALLYALHSIDASPTDSDRRRRLAAALTSDYGNLLNTYRASEPVVEILVSADGGTVIGALQGGRIQRWNTTTGQPLGTTVLQMNEAEIPPAAGEQKAGAPRQLRPPDRPSENRILAVSSDGSRLVAATFPGGLVPGATLPATLRLFDAASGRSLTSGLRLSIAGTEPFPVARFSPDGNTVAIAGGSNIRVCSVRKTSESGTAETATSDSRMRCQSFRAATTPLYGGLAFSSTGERMAVLSINALEIWSTSRTARKLFEIPGPFFYYSPFYGQGEIAFISERIVAVQSDQGVALVDLEKKQILRTLDIAGGIIDFSPSPDGKTLSVVTPGSVEVRSMETGEATGPPWAIPEVEQFSSRPQLSADGRTLFSIGANMATILQWRIGPGQKMENPSVNVDAPVIRMAEVGPNGSLLAILTVDSIYSYTSPPAPTKVTSRIRVFEFPGGRLKHELSLRDDVTELRFLRGTDGLLIRTPQEVKLWKYGVDTIPIFKTENGYAPFAINTGGKMVSLGLLFGPDGFCRLVSAETGYFESEIPNCRNVVLDETGQNLISLQTDGKLRLVSRAENSSWVPKQIIAIPNPESVQEVVFGPGPSRIMTSSATLVAAWDIKDPAHPIRIRSWPMGNGTNVGLHDMFSPSTGQREVLGFLSGWIHDWRASDDGSIVLNSRPLLRVPWGPPTLTATNTVQYAEINGSRVSLRTVKTDLSDVSPLENNGRPWKEILEDWAKRLALRLTPDLAIEDRWSTQ